MIEKKSLGGDNSMKNQYVLAVLLLFAVSIFISCAVKTPDTDSGQTQAYKLEDLPLSDSLVKQIKNGDQEKYTIYTFYTVLDEEKIHKQYWNGIIVFDDLEDSGQAGGTTDDLGIRTVGWREDKLRKSYSEDFYNTEDMLYKRMTINPDGSSIDAVDLNGDGVVDYMETIKPNGDIDIIVSERLGQDFLDSILGGLNPYCNYADVLGVLSEDIPGCNNQGDDSGDSGSGLGLGAADSGNPYHNYMEGMCSGYESSPRDNINDGTRSRKLINTDVNRNVTTNEDERTVTILVEETYNDGTSITHRSIEITNDAGYSEVTTETTVNRPNDTSTTTRRSEIEYPDGSKTNHTTVNDCASNTCTTRETIENTTADGTSTTHEQESETTCDDSNLCTTVGPIEVESGGDTGHPGFEADHGAAMAEFCAIWEQSKKDRPNDVSDLNERANEERCSIEPDESGATEGSSLAETCYFDIAGRDEIAELIAGGTCVTASGGTHFDYDSEGPQRCTQNRFFILERGIVINGSSGVSGVELCENDLACDPADF